MPKCIFRRVCGRKKIGLLEAIEFLISDLPNVKQAIFFIGAPNSGKSVLLRFITRLVGESNVSNVALSEFDQRFLVIEMYRKTLNVSGEIPASPLSGRALDVFKGITGNDRMQFEGKGKQAFSGVITTKLLCAGNALPTFEKTDGTTSVIDRMHIIIFEKSVAKENRNMYLEQNYGRSVILFLCKL